MSRGLRLGGRVFVPSAGFTVVALVLCALCVRLGAWQWHKGMQREQEWTRFARGADQVIALGARAVGDVPLFQRVSVTGRLESARQFLLDNRTYRGRAGYEVLTPLARAGAAVLLVDRGWVPFSGSRARLPDIAFEAAAPVTLSGRLAELPSPGLASGRAGPGFCGSTRRPRSVTCATGSRPAWRRCGTSPTPSSGGASRRWRSSCGRS